jgi:hypothetical protein
VGVVAGAGDKPEPQPGLPWPVNGFNITLVVTAGKDDCTVQATFTTHVRVLEKPCLLEPSCSDVKKTGRLTACAAATASL